MRVWRVDKGVDRFNIPTLILTHSPSPTPHLRGTLQVASIYLSLSRVKRSKDVAILQSFDIKVLQIRPSHVQDAELKCLDELDRKTQREGTCFNF